jgi:hypothetical protein
MSNLTRLSARRIRGAVGPALSLRGQYDTDQTAKHTTFRTCAAWLAACTLLLTGVNQAAAGVCRPALAIKNVQLSPMTPPTMERKWSATVTVDASRCATTAGYFEIGFLREKENGMELEFREQFIWSAPSQLVGLDLWADEAVERAWIDSIQACPCPR